MLATATPAEVTSEQLARALYSNYVGHAHIDLTMLSLCVFLSLYFVCTPIVCAQTHVMLLYRFGVMSCETLTR